MRKSILQKLEKMHLGHFEYLPRELGFELREYKGLNVINCGFNSSMFNIVFGGLANLNQEDIDQVINIFDGKPFAWWIPPSQVNPEMSDLLKQIGFIQEASEDAMFCDLNQINKEDLMQKTDLVVKLVEGDRQLSDFIDIIKVYDDSANDFYNKIKGNDADLDEKLFVGYIDSKPVVIGILYFEDETAAIFSLITSESMRGRGYGTDTMKYLLNFAKKNGANIVTLSASGDNGYRIYERLGFEKVGRFECFEWVNHVVFKEV